MKKAIIPVTLAAVLTAAALLSGCTTTGPGGVTTEEKYFVDFTRVDVEGTFEIEIIQSDSFSISISADSSFFDYVAVTKEGATLRIYLNPRHAFTDFTLQAKTLKAIITMPVLRGLSLSGATGATVTGFKSSEDFNINVSGASSLTVDDIEVGNAKSDISGASKITGKINAGDLEFKVSGASQVELEGLANNIILNASGASKVNLANLPLNNANINLRGASEATLHVKGKLDFILSDASRLYFQGNPTIGNISLSGASTIKHE